MIRTTVCAVLLLMSVCVGPTEGSVQLVSQERWVRVRTTANDVIDEQYVEAEGFEVFNPTITASAEAPPVTGVDGSASAWASASVATTILPDLMVLNVTEEIRLEGCDEFESGAYQASALVDARFSTTFSIADSPHPFVYVSGGGGGGFGGNVIWEGEAKLTNLDTSEVIFDYDFPWWLKTAKEFPVDWELDVGTYEFVVSHRLSATSSEFGGQPWVESGSMGIVNQLILGEPIPEPSTLTLLSAAAVGIFAYTARRRRRDPQGPRDRRRLDGESDFF